MNIVKILSKERSSSSGYPRLKPSIITGKEQFFEENEVIVSKTDSRGIITYVNDVFLRVSGYKEKELIGRPHNLIRHPHMPKCVFKLLWDTLKNGDEIFAYVVNLTKSGDHYWVFAHVTPTFSTDGTITGMHSNRRVPSRSALVQIEALYAQLLGEEKKYNNSKSAILASYSILVESLQSKGVSYDEFILSL